MTELSPNDDPAFPSQQTDRPERAIVSLVTDAVLVVLFAVWGNISHDSGLSPAEVWSTAWPFLLGLALGWGLTYSWRYPTNIWPVGIFLVAFVVASGMVMRHFFTDGGVQLSFVVVATLSIGALLLARRLLTAALTRRR